MPTKTIEPPDAWSLKAQQKQRFLVRGRFVWVSIHGVPGPEPGDAGSALFQPFTHQRALSYGKKAKRVRGAVPAKTRSKPKKVADTGSKVRKAIETARRGANLPEAICKLIRYEGSEAVCEVEVDGYRLSGVSLPAGAVKAKSVQPGDRFTWTMRESGPIRRSDIGPRIGPVSDRLTVEQRMELETLYSDSRRREGEGEEWTEYTGPGQ